MKKPPYNFSPIDPAKFYGRQRLLGSLSASSKQLPTQSDDGPRAGTSQIPSESSPTHPQIILHPPDIRTPSPDSEVEVMTSTPIATSTPPNTSIPVTPNQPSGTPSQLQAPNTVLANKLATDNPYTSTYHVSDEVRVKMAAEMQGKFIGPQPIERFLDSFLPKPAGQGDPPAVSFADVAQAKREIDMYDPFITVCNELLLDDLEWVNTSAHPDPATVPAAHPQKLGHKPDVMVYRLESSRRRATDFGAAEIPGEFKFDINTDGFCDDKSGGKEFPFEKDTDQAVGTRGQLVAYMNCIFQLQFRLFGFSFLICSSKARLLRWDRSGVVVSEAFDYVENPRPFAEFFWRYNFMSRSQRGYDENVVEIRSDMIGADELKSCRKALGIDDDDAERLYLLRMPSHSAPPALPVQAPAPHHTPAPSPISAFSTAGQIPSSSALYGNANAWQFIAVAPAYRDRSTTGTTPRAMCVYERPSRHLRYLKETWRINLPEYEEEGKIIAKLKSKAVPHLGEVLYAYDVLQAGGQTDTQTDLLSKCEWTSKNAVNTPHRLYRLVYAEVGVPLFEFSSTRQLVQAMADVIEAHMAAEAADIWHRDISVDSILITADGRGWLIGWHLAKRVTGMNIGKPRGDELEATWQFTSATRLYDPNAPHFLMDEHEAFFWVLLWIVLRFGRHSLDAVNLSSNLKDIYDSTHIRSHGSAIITAGGKDKMSMFTAGNFNDFFGSEFYPAPLNELLSRLLEGFVWRYRRLPRKPTDPSEFAYSRRIEEYNQAVKTRDRSLEALKAGKWISALFHAVLKKPGWPVADRAKANPIHHGKDSDLAKQRSESRRSTTHGVESLDIPRPPKIQRTDSDRRYHQGKASGRYATQTVGQSAPFRSREHDERFGPSVDHGDILPTLNAPRLTTTGDDETTEGVLTEEEDFPPSDVAISSDAEEYGDDEEALYL